MRRTNKSILHFRCFAIARLSQELSKDLESTSLGDFSKSLLSWHPGFQAATKFCR